MKTAILLTAMLVAGTALAIAPAAQARGVCTSLVDAWCDSAVCVNDFCSRDLNPVCVTEPCPQPIP